MAGETGEKQRGVHRQTKHRMHEERQGADSSLPVRTLCWSPPSFPLSSICFPLLSHVILSSHSLTYSLLPSLPPPFLPPPSLPPPLTPSSPHSLLPLLSLISSNPGVATESMVQIGQQLSASQRGQVVRMLTSMDDLNATCTSIEDN